MGPDREGPVVFDAHPSLLADRDPFEAYGLAVTERDGDPRVVVAGNGDPNRFLRWDGDALVDELDEFRARSGVGSAPDGGAAALRAPDRHAIGVAAGDIDADGEEEVYVHATGSFAGGSPEADLLCDPTDDGFVNLFDDARNRGARNYTAGRSVAAIDRTGDGTHEFLVTGYAAPMRLYGARGGVLDERAADVGVDFLGGGRTLVVGPLVGTRTDVFVGMERGPNLLLANDGGGFTDFAPERGVSDTHEQARGAALVDTGDGLGLVLGNWNGHHRLFTGGDGRWTDVAPPAMVEPAPVRSVVAADFDDDGRQELFFNCLGGANRFFSRADGDWTAVDPGAATEPDARGTGAVAADVDGDGRLELLVAHGEGEGAPLSAFRAAPADGAGSLRVRPRTRHGAPARGAFVRLETDAGDDTAVQRRVVDGGSGYLCQGEPVAHFGLGGAAPERVTVRWPDGETTAEVEAPPPNEVLTVERPV
jgi:hypothetical protein